MMVSANEFRCIFCQRGLAEGISVSRINEKGVPGIWACREHRHLSDNKFDPFVDAIVAALEKGRKP